ncbi:MAG: hypothetical protein PHP64_07210 [Actinomycetota bacterium]|nr:hypothetical protein [Actinomycetota bacterium]
MPVKNRNSTFLPNLLKLILTLILVFTFGCGGNKALAESLAKKGDRILSNIISKSAALESKTGTLLDTLNEKLKGGSLPDPSWFKSQVSEISLLTDSIRKEAKEAKSNYDKVLKMKGLDVYAEYAGTKIDIIDLNITSIGELENLLTNAEQSISSGTFSPQTFAKNLLDYGNLLTKRSERISVLEDDAEKLARELKL